VVLPRDDEDNPKVLTFAKLWKPKYDQPATDRDNGN
jgi:hypothetical protein